MPPLDYSRFIYSKGLTDEDGNLYLSDSEPFEYQDSTENRYHQAVEGDTWWSLAERYFSEFDEPAQFFWILCEYQPTPVIDPTIAITPGTIVVIPSVRMVQEELFSEERRQ